MNVALIFLAAAIFLGVAAGLFARTAGALLAFGDRWIPKYFQYKSSLLHLQRWDRPEELSPPEPQSGPATALPDKAAIIAERVWPYDDWAQNELVDELMARWRSGEEWDTIETEYAEKTKHLEELDA